MSVTIESVNRIVLFLRDEAKGASPALAAKLSTFASQMEQVRDDLVRLYGLTSALPPDLGNVFDLPEDLRKQISSFKGDEIEDQIVLVINAYEGTASLDQILVGLYRKFKASHKRRFIQNKLYRMRMVWPAPEQKGYFTTTPPSNLALSNEDLTDERTEYPEDYGSEGL